MMAVVASLRLKQYKIDEPGMIKNSIKLNSSDTIFNHQRLHPTNENNIE